MGNNQSEFQEAYKNFLLAKNQHRDIYHDGLNSARSAIESYFEQLRIMKEVIDTQKEKMNKLAHQAKEKEIQVACYQLNPEFIVT